MADALITRLASTDRIAVKPTAAVLRYGGKEQNLTAVAGELGVELVMSGHIQRLGDQIRLTVQIVRGSDGSPVWADQFDGSLTDIFSTQDRLAKQIATALSLKLTGEGQKLLTKRHTEDSEAYQLYIKGRYFWNKRTTEGLRKAVEHFQQAIGRDQNYALAHAALADCYVLGGNGLPLKEALGRAKESALKALAIDETLAEAHNALAFAIWRNEFDWTGAEREFKRALEIDPNYATAHQWYGLYLTSLGRFDEAVMEEKRALEIDPLSLSINTELAAVYCYARQIDKAVEQCQRTLDLDPSFVPALITLGSCYLQKGMLDEAMEVWQIAAANNPDVLIRPGFILTRLLRGEDAKKLLNEMQSRSRRKKVDPASMAAIYLHLRDNERAVDWLERGVEERSAFIYHLRTAYWLDSLRPHPKFEELLRRIGLEH